MSTAALPNDSPEVRQDIGADLGRGHGPIGRYHGVSSAGIPAGSDDLDGVADDLGRVAPIDDPVLGVRELLPDTQREEDGREALVGTGPAEDDMEARLAEYSLLGSDHESLRFASSANPGPRDSPSVAQLHSETLM